MRTSPKTSRAVSTRARGRTDRRIWQLFAAVLAMTLVLAACGNGDEPPADEPAEEPAEAPAEEPAEDADDAPAAIDAPPVRYTQAGTSLSFANLLYAQSEGLFEAEGLEMDYQPFPPSSGDMITILVAGDADVAFGAPSAMYSAVTQGRDLMNYASTQIGPALGIAISNELAEELAADGITVDSPVEERIAALEGRNIAGIGAGSATHSLFGMALATAGLDLETDITLLPVPDHGEAANSTREGQSDGYYAAVPALMLGEHDGWGTLWVSYLDVPGLSTMPWIEFTSSTAYAEEYPEVIEALLRAIDRANQAFIDDPEHVHDVLKENWFEETDPDLFRLAFDLAAGTFTQGIYPSEEGLVTQLEVNNVGAEIPLELTFDEVYDTSFLDRLGIS